MKALLVILTLMAVVLGSLFVHPVIGDWTGTHFDNRSNAEKMGWIKTE